MRSYFLISCLFLLSIGLLIAQSKKESIHWNNITKQKNIDTIIKNSYSKPQLIYKHSTKCSLNAKILGQLQNDWKKEYADKIEPNYLDLLSYKKISSQIASTFDVVHESPQVLVIKNGKCVYTVSHTKISLSNILTHIE